MIKDNQKYFNRLHVVLDAAVVAIAYAIAWWIRFKSGFWPQETEQLVGTLDAGVYFSALIFIVPGYLVLNHLNNLYTSKRYSSAKRDVINVIKANVIGLILFISFLYIVDQKHFSRGMIFVFCALNIIGQSGTRIMIRKLLRSFRRKGYNIKYVLLVGSSKAA